LYEVLIIIFLFSSKTAAKDIIQLLDVSNKTVTDWIRYLRNTYTRILHLIEIRLGGKDKWVQINETHWFKIPKHFRGLFNKLCN